MVFKKEENTDSNAFKIIALSVYFCFFLALKIKNLSFSFLNQQNLEKIVMFKVRKRKTVF